LQKPEAKFGGEEMKGTRSRAILIDHVSVPKEIIYNLTSEESINFSNIFLPCFVGLTWNLDVCGFSML